MPIFHIVTSQTIETENEEQAIQIVKDQPYSSLDRGTMIALIRDQDRSAKNLLHPKIEGRFANHLSSKKISVKDL